MIKLKSKYSCKSTIYFDLVPDIIKDNCKFTSKVLDGENEIILENWLNDKHINCKVNNDIPVKIPSCHMFWLTEVYYATIGMKQKTISFWNLWLHAMVQIPN